VHALKFALVTKARLAILHATAKTEEERMHFPGVRDTLERWKFLPRKQPPERGGQCARRLHEGLNLAIS
jgi:hypothetical protein